VQNDKEGRMKIYVIGSLRNPEVPKIATKIREAGYEVFDDWYSAGPEADDMWRTYEKNERGHTYAQALEGYAAKHVFEFDKHHLGTAYAVILVLPAGKSGHLELGWAIGKGKRGYILLDDPERWDVMYQFADVVTDKLDVIVTDLNNEKERYYGRRTNIELGEYPAKLGPVLSEYGRPDCQPVKG
jgi:hypothetical protein